MDDFRAHLHRIVIELDFFLIYLEASLFHVRSSRSLICLEANLFHVKYTMGYSLRFRLEIPDLL